MFYGNLIGSWPVFSQMKLRGQRQGIFKYFLPVATLILHHSTSCAHISPWNQSKKKNMELNLQKELVKTECRNQLLNLPNQPCWQGWWTFLETNSIHKHYKVTNDLWSLFDIMRLYKRLCCRIFRPGWCLWFCQETIWTLITLAQGNQAGEDIEVSFAFIWRGFLLVLQLLSTF